MSASSASCRTRCYVCRRPIPTTSPAAAPLAAPPITPASCPVTATAIVAATTPGAVSATAGTIYLVGPGADGHPPGFVYGIFFSLFVLFNCFAVNQWLQYKQVGKWRDYLVGERVYVTLSLIAKSLLAWQIFAATLASSAAH